MKLPKIIKDKPTLATVVSCAGVVLSMYVTANGTVKALKVIDEKKPQTKKETVKVSWKYYIPAVILGGATIYGITLVNILNKKQQALLISTAMITTKKLNEYRDTVRKQYGEDVDMDIRNQIASTKPKKIKDVKSDDEILCYEAISEQWFYSTKYKLLEAEKLLNEQYHDSYCVCMNDWLNLLDIPEIGIKGDVCGWDSVDLYEQEHENSIIIHRVIMQDQDGNEYLYIYPTEPYLYSEG